MWGKDRWDKSRIHCRNVVGCVGTEVGFIVGVVVGSWVGVGVERKRGAIVLTSQL